MQPFHELHVQRLQPEGGDEGRIYYTFTRIKTNRLESFFFFFNLTFIFDGFPMGTECEIPEGTTIVICLFSVMLR